MEASILDPQWGINKSKTSHYFQSIQHWFWVCFPIITFVFICYENKVLFESSSSIYCIFALRFYISNLELYLSLHFF